MYNDDMTYIPGRITKVDCEKDCVRISIEHMAGHVTHMRIVDADPEALWAAGEYWMSLMEHGEQLRCDIEDEMRDMGTWQDDDEN
jgi:hypothetical protein